MNRHSRCRSLQPSRRLTQTDGLDFALDTPRATRFNLLRLVPDHTFRYRHLGRGETQRAALDQDSSQFNAIQLSLDSQAAGCSAAASTATTASSRTSIIDLDFSSFIIGDGSVTARFILMVR
ncbi:MAG: hypothetical protein H6R17_2433 [Proteobacteria bacterium]|nr:hypothetical protein [Pseudomonadota bacterium]